MTAEQVVNAGGPVELRDAAGKVVTLFVLELSTQAEIGLLRKLRALARAALGPGSFFAAALPALNWMKEQGHHADRAHLMEIIGRLIATGGGVSDDAADEFRRSPDGVAEELFWRTRKTCPDVTLDELRAAINEVNALEVHLAILDAIAPKAPPASGATPSG
jgi:hypothetical protein